MPHRLGFEKLRQANLKRLVEVWPQEVGCTQDRWVSLLTEELGEVARLVNRVGSEKELLADELADLVIYADLMAASRGINLGEAIKKKFNATSAKVGSEVKL